MQARYQVAAHELQGMVKKLVTAFKAELTTAGLNRDALLDESIAVEMVAFALIDCLTEERLVVNSFENKLQARQEALEIVKSAVIDYRGHTLIPLTEH